MVKVSINRFVSRRVEKVRKEVEVSTQRLRKKTLKHLEEIFTMAARVAKGEIKHQRIDGKMVRITLNQRKVAPRRGTSRKNHQQHLNQHRRTRNLHPTRQTSETG